MTAFPELEAMHDEPPIEVDRYRCKKLNFNTASPVVLPTGLLVLSAVLRLQLKSPLRKILITAHTDTTDSKANNQKLSDRRARSVLLILQHERAEWAQLAADNYRDQDVKEILTWAASCWTWDCKPDGGGAKGLKKAWDAAYPTSNLVEANPTSALNAGFWARIFQLYQVRLMNDYLGVTNLASNKYINALKWVDDDYKSIGCGERRWFIETKDGVDEPENRRIDILFFEPGEEPTAGNGTQGEIEGHPALLEDPYGARYFLNDLDCPKPYYPTGEILPGNVLFVLDISGSMNGARIQRARRDLIGALAAFDKRYHFGIVAYSSCAQTIWAVGAETTFTFRNGSTATIPDVPNGGEVKLLQASDETIRDAIAWVAGLPVYGSTQAYHALELALSATNLRDINTDNGERNTLNFLSDGSPTQRAGSRVRSPAGECAAIVTMVKSRNKVPWRINTLGFFATAPAQATRDMMRNLPRQTQPYGRSRTFRV